MGEIIPFPSELTGRREMQVRRGFLRDASILGLLEETRYTDYVVDSDVGRHIQKILTIRERWGTGRTFEEERDLGQSHLL